MGGLAWAFSVEPPELRCMSVALDPARPEDVDALWVELASSPQGDQVAFRDGTRLVPRLLPAAVSGPAEALSLRTDATYLITGGLGGLGLRLTHWMAGRGARHLVLTGRRGATAAAATARTRAA